MIHTKKSIIGLVLGGAMLYFTMNGNSGLYRLMSFFGMLLLGLSAITLFRNTEELIKAHMPKGKEGRSLLIYETLYRTSCIMLLLGIVMLITELLGFATHLRPWDFWKVFGVVGLSSGFSIAYLLPYYSYNVYQKSTDRFTIFWGMVLGVTLLTIALGSKINRVFGNQSTYKVEYEIIEKNVYNEKNAKPIRYEFTIAPEEGKTKDLPVSQALYNTLNNDDNIAVELRDGFLGYEIITSVAGEKWNRLGPR